MNATTTRLPRMLTVREIADQFALCDKTIRRLIKSGQLRAHYIGRTVRIAEEDAAACMAARRR
jgi:excisionase family DNA binding protein